MTKPDFVSMTRTELRQYILDHREDQEPLEVYIDRFQNPNNKVFPAPESIEDLENFPELHRQNLEKQRKQA
ncbi:DUF6887 family protein [Fischerella sp. PCC 9605]|uniref:DUF6887 family protein n=1 Tax=Fischerella sp. PCC 9605 TaxID=1173024 RepID=UPI0004794C9E|nr:hypothetical protein [Fischerella sp. PCC 9605]